MNEFMQRRASQLAQENFEEIAASVIPDEPILCEIAARDLRVFLSVFVDTMRTEEITDEHFLRFFRVWHQVWKQDEETAKG